MEMLNTKTPCHFITPYFAHPKHPITINVIGVGGTGSLLLPRLAKINAVLLELGHPGIYVVAYDDDVFETTNIIRQQCTFADVGRNKAIATIEKINFAYGFGWEAVPKKVNPNKLYNMESSNIFITCVDDASFRVKLDKHFKKNVKKANNYQNHRTPFYWIDCGNGKNFGQIILSTVKDLKQPKTDKFNAVKRLLSVIDIYGDLKKYDTEEIQQTKGCSILDKLEEQDVFVNDLAAVYASKLIKKLFFQTKIENQGVIFNDETSMPFKIFAKNEY